MDEVLEIACVVCKDRAYEPEEKIYADIEARDDGWLPASEMFTDMLYSKEEWVCPDCVNYVRAKIIWENHDG